MAGLKAQYAQEEKWINSQSLSPYEKQDKLEDAKHRLFGRYEHQLDTHPYGACHLSDQNVAQILYDKVLQYDQIHYDLHALSIMPNHVHFLADTSIHVYP